MKVNIGKYPRGNGERKVTIKIDPYDTWSMDHTLALIIHPMLIQLKKTKHGASFVSDEDVPEELRSTSAPELTEEEKNCGHTDTLFFDRWDWVLNEMIWAFAQLLDDSADDQFHTGKSDIQWKEIEVGAEKMYEMVRGPEDTHVFDQVSWEKWSERKKNGFRLFGKYYEGLWD
jgi:hypothetical protein